MRVRFHSIIGVALLCVLMGCSSPDKDKKKNVPTIPERAAEAVFKNMTEIQVKNSLMSACSQSLMRILPDQNEVLCIRHRLDEAREQMLVNLVNDDFARNIADSVKFVITPEGRDVRVVGNPYVQFATPLGIETNAGVKMIRINLRDDASFTMVETLLKQAGATKPL